MSKGKRRGLFIILIIGLFTLYLKIRPDPNHIQNQWQEEVQLADGQIIWVTRKANYERTNTGFMSNFIDAASRGRVVNMMLTIEIPATQFISKPPIWRFNALPLDLDYDREKKTWVIIASYFYCDSWEAAGEPALGQWQYIVKDNRWVIQALDKKYIGLNPNIGLDFMKLQMPKKVTKEEIKKVYYHLPDGDSYKTINMLKQNCNNTVSFKPKF